MVVGEGLLSAARFALRVVACGNALSLTLAPNLSRSFSSFPAWAEYLIADSLGSSGTFESDGGGGRIRTFEVDDGRFTVCSLWPLGNPTGLDGADYRNRTGDLLITSQLLYLLS